MPQHKNQVNLDPNTKTKYFSTFTHNQVNSDPDAEIKSSSIPPHWNQVNFDHPYKNLVKFDPPHKN